MRGGVAIFRCGASEWVGFVMGETERREIEMGGANLDMGFFDCGSGGAVGCER